jgi:hypothetical protein
LPRLAGVAKQPSPGGTGTRPDGRRRCGSRGGRSSDWVGDRAVRRFSDDDLRLAFERVLAGVSYVDIASELNCSLKLLYRQFGTQRERASAPAKAITLTVVTSRVWWLHADN